MAEKNCKYCFHYDVCYAVGGMTERAETCTKYAPAADVVEVKHGKWYRHDKKIHGDTCYYCSECERMALTDCGMVWELTSYCPFCGAKMDGGKENEQT